MFVSEGIKGIKEIIVTYIQWKFSKNLVLRFGWMRGSVAHESFLKTAFVGGHNPFCLHKELKSFCDVLDLCQFDGNLNSKYCYVDKQKSFLSSLSIVAEVKKKLDHHH